MPSSTSDHKLLDILQHLWPYISALFVAMFTAARLMWNRHKETRERLEKIEVLIMLLSEKKVSKDELQACRDDVRDDDEKNLDLIFKKLKSIEDNQRIESIENSRQHQEILKQGPSGHRR